MTRRHVTNRARAYGQRRHDVTTRRPAPRRAADSDFAAAGLGASGASRDEGRRLPEVPDRALSSGNAQPLTIGADGGAPRVVTVGVDQPHPGQTSSAREPSITGTAGPAGAPVCRAGARDVKRERRARVAHSTPAVPVPSAAASRLDAGPFAAALAARPDLLPARRPPDRHVPA